MPDEMALVLAAPADIARKGTGTDPSKTAATAPVNLRLCFIQHPSAQGATILGSGLHASSPDKYE